MNISSEQFGGNDSRVMRIRQQIAAGNYETPEKLDKAIDNLLADLVEERRAQWEMDNVGDRFE